MSKFRGFGCRAFMTLNKDRRGPGKLRPRAVEGINLGFASDSNTSGYVIFIPENGKTFISNQVRFDETSYPYRKQSIIDKYAADESVDILYARNKTKFEPYQAHHPAGYYKKHRYNATTDELILQVADQPDTFASTTQYQYFRDILDVQKAYLATIVDEGNSSNGAQPGVDLNKPPKNFKDALSRKDANDWIESYRREYQGFIDRDALEVVPRPKGAKVLGTLTRNEYKTKNGVLDKLKTRWCVRGDQQDYQINDSYAPVLKAPEVRLITAIAAEHGADMYSTDTKQAFLYGDMSDDEDVFVEPPDWWFAPIPDGHVFRLKKAIYGTKQAARRWHTKISTWMEDNGYPACNSEKTIFMKRDGDDFIIHGLFVDDIKSVPTKKSLLDEFLKKYSRAFQITGGKLMDRFIGLSVEQNKKHIALHLDEYIAETIAEYQKLNCNKTLRPKLTPMQPGNILNPLDSPIIPDKKRQTIYRSMVARLQFAATWVRLDISYAVAQLARYCASAGPTHWAALHHLMEYLTKRPSFKLVYRKRPTAVKGLDGYCDADWGTDSTRRSTSGLVFRYNGAPIYWRSKLQKTIALSTAEAEYYAASLAASEVIYLRALLGAMGFPQGSWTPVYEDNNACIEWCNNVIGGRERAKHIDLRKYYAHEAVQNGFLRLVRVDTADQLADVFTKSLHPRPFEKCIGGILGQQWPADS